jgi:hypothetical protein
MSDRVHPHQALAVYAEPLAAGRRVVVFGDAASGLAERIEELGATAVVVATPDDELEELDALRGARFDVAIVSDLAAFDDPADLLARVRRLVGESGAAIVAAPNRDAAEVEGEGALDYYALFDLVAKEFADVRMVAQLPFHGLALAEVGDEDDSPAVSVDTQLADEDRTPEAFVAVASQRGTRLDPYFIVELPVVPVAAPLRDDTELLAARAHLDDARAQVQTLAAQLDALEGRAARATELERELASRGRTLAELSSEVEEMRSAAEAGRIAAAQVESLALRAERAERALAMVEPELARVADGHAAELQQFEEALRERAAEIRELEAEVVRRERMVRELVGALEENGSFGRNHAQAHVHGDDPRRVDAPAAPAPATDDAAFGAVAAENARLQQKLDSLARDLARREGDAQAGAWTIAELERKLAPGAAQPRPATGSTSAGGLDELDALRKALTQEHDARVRAESGEELVRARAEIQRQAALLVQVGRSPGHSAEGAEPAAGEGAEPAAGAEELR